MKILRIPSLLTEAITAYRKENPSGKTVGFVPTMGGLHAGHRSLIKRSVGECDLTVVSVFLNPTQFNNPEDLRTYPHNEADDLRLLEDAGVDIAFLPTPEVMYSEGEKAPELPLGRVAEVQEGAFRPGHFQGVVWVVGKLFRLVMPDKAYFGLKDFQQISVIKRMIEVSEDLQGIEIVSCPVVREEDGLAMSSRNRRLSPEERQAAPLIYAMLKEGKRLKGEGKSVREIHDFVARELNANPLLQVEYFSICDGKTLEEISDWTDSAEPVGAITVYCGEVRLIDHISFN